MGIPVLDLHFMFRLMFFFFLLRDDGGDRAASYSHYRDRSVAHVADGDYTNWETCVGHLQHLCVADIKCTSLDTDHLNSAWHQFCQLVAGVYWTKEMWNEDLSI